jgi:hypothetical protein
LFVPTGDLLSAGLVLVGTTVVGLGAIEFGIVNIVLAATGLTIALAVGRSYARLTTRPTLGSARAIGTPTGAPVRAR